MNYTRAKLSGRMYGGSEKKLGIIIEGEPYMLKFQKNTPFGKRNNHICEYIGSHIFNTLGVKAHETFLGTYKGEQVVACRDFNVAGIMFVPFNGVGESTLEEDRELYRYTYSDIKKVLIDNSRLVDVEETVSSFWDMFIIDALIGNFDRHGSNWGFLKEKGEYRLAPVFDNGSCLYPNMTDEDEMERIILSEEETCRRIYDFPTSQIKYRGKKSSYYDIISSLEFEECNNALKRIVSRTNMKEIDSIVENTPYITDIQESFYRHMLNERYRRILLESYGKLVRK